MHPAFPVESASPQSLEDFPSSHFEIKASCFLLPHPLLPGRNPLPSFRLHLFRETLSQQIHVQLHDYQKETGHRQLSAAFTCCSRTRLWTSSSASPDEFGRTRIIFKKLISAISLPACSRIVPFFTYTRITPVRVLTCSLLSAKCDIQLVRTNCLGL
ncbi:hypothetical protein K438DRAFT_1875231 [Mycena galopus ATCC 62051]|nr:hypothetical protein K438DRAFT_1875231 [Mycena galopus ATCC 62051]